MLPLLPRSGAAQSVIARIGSLSFCLGLLTSLLLLRLWHLQIIQGQELRERSENNRIRLERMRAPRGRIFDRNGVELVTNRPAYNLIYYPEEAAGSFSLEQLAEVAGLNLDDLKAVLEREKRAPSFQPRTLAWDLRYDQVARIESRLADFSGLSIEIEPRRYYKFGKLAAHSLGTVGIINETEWETLKDDPDGRFAQSDYIGKSGVEKMLNNVLAGRPGYRRFESDAAGRKVAWIDDIPAQAGQDVILNIDFRLQMIIDEAFADWKGAAIAIDPRNGEVLAVHSAPSFDPNLFAGSVSSSRISEIFTDPARPLLNRAIATAYQPGSVFKTVTLMAGFKQGKVDAKTGASCGGTTFILGQLRHCWKKEGHGRVNYRSALIHSCNVFFYHLGNNVGIDALGAMGQAVGFGQKTGIELSGEVSGIMPTPEWKRRVLSQPWWKGETISVAIGQGMLQITPLQAAELMAMVSTGARYKPHLVREIRDSAPDQNGAVIYQPQPELVATLDIKPEHLALVRDALDGVVEEGTGRKAKNAAFPVSGKTGTAQVVQLELGKGKVVPEKYRDHNWFACYVSNGQEPVLAMTVFLQNGGKIGMETKAGIAGQIIANYMPLIYPERAALFESQKAEAQSKPKAAAETKAPPKPNKPKPKGAAEAKAKKKPAKDVAKHD